MIGSEKLPAKKETEMTKRQIKADLGNTVLKIYAAQSAAAADHNWALRDELNAVAMKINELIRSI